MTKTPRHMSTNKQRGGYLSSLLALMVVALASVASPAQAASPVRIAKIYYGSPGSDDRSNTSLNGEYVVLKNYSTAAKPVGGWSVKDAAGHSYILPRSTIGAGKTLTIKTGKGTNSGTVHFWGRAAYVWNNDKDTTSLRTSSGTVAHSCSYNSTAYDYKTC